MVDSIRDAVGAKEAAALLGTHVETVRRLARRGAIPSFKVGRDWRFSVEAVRAWAGGQTPSPSVGTILIVDDDVDYSRALCRVVQREGFRTEQASGGAEALAMISRNVPGLVLLDLLMPEMTGVEFLKRVRVDHATLPIAIVTGYPESSMLFDAMRFGPLVVLPKPFDVEQLKCLLHLVLGKRSAVA